MPSGVLYATTLVWALLVAVVVTDWRGLRSRRPYAYPLLAAGGLLYVVREWTAALWTLHPTVELALAIGSNLAFVGVLVLVARRWVRLRG